MASPNLPSLPTELIQEIARHLAACDSDVLSLRQTCRQLHAKTHHPFLDQHFAHRRHLFTEHSLKALAALARDEGDLGPAVRRLDLSLLPFEHTRDRNAVLHNPASPFHVPDPFRRAALAVFLNAQARCRRADVDVALLAAALRRLPNLRALRLSSDEPAGCWGYRKLGRDLGWPAYMACAGGSGGGRRAGGGPLLPGTYAFETALVAIAAAAAGDGDGDGDGVEAAAVAIHELEVEGGLPPSALVLEERGLVERLRAPMAHVRVLTLFVSLPLRTAVVIGGDQGAGATAGVVPAAAAAAATDALDPNADDSNNTTHFLSLLPNLEVLRLGAARGRTSNLDRFLADMFLQVDGAAPSAKLKALHLLRLDCRRGDVLGPVLRRCRALEYLVLEDGAARESCWRPAMRYAAEARHPSLVGVLCKRFEVLPDDDGDDVDGDGDVVVGEGSTMTATSLGDEVEGERSPFLEYGGGDDTSGGLVRHLVVDRGEDDDERPRLGQRLPWRVFSTPEFWEKEKVLFQIR